MDETTNQNGAKAMDEKNNTGDMNTGHWNTGDMNTGDMNTGDMNTGHMNTGHRNTGDMNTGDMNTGHRNTGDMNTGHRNTGGWNTGDWNTGDWNTGFFCESNGPVIFFDQPCNMTREEACHAIPYIELPIGVEWVSRGDMTPEEVTANPSCDTIGGYFRKRELPIREAFPLAWAKLDIDDKRRFMALPNFDADKFERITGVDVRQDRDLFPAMVEKEEQPADEIIVGGKRYKLVPVE